MNFLIGFIYVLIVLYLINSSILCILEIYIAIKNFNKNQKYTGIIKH